MRMIHPLILIFAALLTLTGCAGNQKEIDALADEIYQSHRLKPPLPPKPFVSDGCSLWPDSGWLECCVEHDLVYWKGGAGQDRLEADRMLKTCVSKKAGPFWGTVMYHGARVGGAWWLPTPFRWGFGWEYPRSGPPGSRD
ncbi:exported hypothetical protein [Candidatus Desulfarcum epimagneticum]|uniref:Lipoprotein n=1 Tax=uncultured Desulfobacteraceae bacterium TaxID=218296 RepID=A0A484HET2_9BACT|nr:exported hypothetical protein [uncultured Desulfobacteraceae bacterium]